MDNADNEDVADEADDEDVADEADTDTHRRHKYTPNENSIIKMHLESRLHDFKRHPWNLCFWKPVHDRMPQHTVKSIMKDGRSLAASILTENPD